MAMEEIDKGEKELGTKEKTKDEKGLETEEKYRILIKARNFQQNSFNKWQTYFYVAIGALFIGYCKVLSKENNQLLENALLVLGFLTSLLWYWSAKGYSYWNTNFIMLVHHYEKELLKFGKEGVYSVFANKQKDNCYCSPILGANISTSKICILFAFVVAVAWGTIFINQYCCCWFVSLAASLGVVYTLSCIVPSCFLKSKMDIIHDLELRDPPVERHL